MRLKGYLPIAIFAGIAVALYAGLSLKPRIIPSALIGKPVPEFVLPPMEGKANGLRTADLTKGEVTLVNIFASWCGPCRAEHPLFVDLGRKGEVTIHAINYKDRPEAAKRWLEQLGDPYNRIGVDESGRTAIDWGVYGVPETFVVTGDGKIACKHVGPVTPEDMQKKILPIVRDLKRDGTTSREC